MTKKVKEVSTDKENEMSKESKQTGVQVDFYTLEYIDKTWNISILTLFANTKRTF